MSDLLHDVFYVTGVLSWGIAVGAGLFLAGVGAVEIITRKIRSGAGAPRLQVVGGARPHRSRDGLPASPTTSISGRASRPRAANGVVRSASKPTTLRASAHLLRPTAPARPFDGDIA